jgi:hypothetical protein
VAESVVTGRPRGYDAPHLMLGALVNLNHTPQYIHGGFFQMSVPNLVVIVLMLVVFAVALFLRAPGAKRGRRPK